MTIISTTDTSKNGKRKRNSHIFERAAKDFYIEPPWISVRLFQVERFPSRTILDPCTGTGRIADAAKAAGYRVMTADIFDRGYPGCKVQDFLQRKSAPASVAGNPPFNAVEAFAEHAFAIGADKVALAFVTQRLNAAHHWLRELPPGDYVLAGGEAKGDKRDFCWLVFERGYRGEPVIRWLHRDGGDL
jgi:hypothetical protein